MSFATDYVPGPRPGELTARNVFVPPWYRPHPDLSVQVMSGEGRALGFTLDRVVPERRWAIGADGRCMSQADFEPKLLDWRKGQFEWQVPPKRTPDLMFEPIPKVEGFVSRGEDPADNRRLVSLEPLRPRLGLLRPNEPLVDEAILKDPRWKPAPKEEKADPRDAELAALRAELARVTAALPIASAPKAPRTYEMLTCPDCGQEGLKGANGLRFHRKHKHKETA